MGGSLLFEEFSDIYSTYPVFKNIKYFVETGTYKGDTTMMAAQHFEKVHTIEIMPFLYEGSKERARKEGVENITFHLGDSLEIIPKILSEINEGAFFFIDAHQSGPDTGNNKVQHVPLLQELDLILKSKIGPSVFIFDDVRFWKGERQQAWDWEHISQKSLLSKFEEEDYNVIDSYLKNDRFYVITV